MHAGVNYSALSCHSCKVFFTRNESKSRDLVCPRAGKCAIDRATRRHCPKCRLQKCFQVGMVKSLVNRDQIDQIPSKSNDEQIPLGSDDENFIAEIPTKLPRKIYSNVSFTPDEVNQIQEVQAAICCSLPNEQRLTLVGEVTSAVESITWPEFYSKKIVKFCKTIPQFKTLTTGDQMAILKPFVAEILCVWCSFTYDATQKGHLIIQVENQPNKQNI